MAMEMQVDVDMSVTSKTTDYRDYGSQGGYGSEQSSTTVSQLPSSTNTAYSTGTSGTNTGNGISTEYQFAYHNHRPKHKGNQSNSQSQATHQGSFTPRKNTDDRKTNDDDDISMSQETTHTKSNDLSTGSTSDVRSQSTFGYNKSKSNTPKHHHHNNQNNNKKYNNNNNKQNLPNFDKLPLDQQIAMKIPPHTNDPNVTNNDSLNQLKYRRSILDYYLGQTIGMGGYSRVKIGFHKQTNEKVAVKIMFGEKGKGVSKKTIKHLEQELSVMKKVKSNNVVGLKAYSTNSAYPESDGSTTPCAVIVMEFAPRGELFDYLMYDGAFGEKLTRTYFHQLMDGLQAIHKSGYAHRDLKPENLLLDNNFTLKIADFGFARSFVDDKGILQTMKTTCGTRGYLSPEVIKRRPYTYKADLFTVGIIMFTTYCAFPPFQEAEKNDWWWKKLSTGIRYLEHATKYANVPEKKPAQYRHQGLAYLMRFWESHTSRLKIDSDFQELMVNLLHPDPNRRFNHQQIRRHKWFQKEIYESKEVCDVMTKKVDHVMKQRARKVQDLMKTITEKGQNYQARPYENPLLKNLHQGIGPFNDKRNEIDPKRHFLEYLEYQKDDTFIFDRCLYQFYTPADPIDVAARFEKIEVELQDTMINIGNQMRKQFEGLKIYILPDTNSIIVKCKVWMIRPHFNDDNEEEFVKARDNNEKKKYLYSNQIYDDEVIFIVKQFVQTQTVLTRFREKITTKKHPKMDMYRTQKSFEFSDDDDDDDGLDPISDDEYNSESESDNNNRNTPDYDDDDGVLFKANTAHNDSESDNDDDNNSNNNNNMNPGTHQTNNNNIAISYPSTSNESNSIPTEQMKNLTIDDDNKENINNDNKNSGNNHYVVVFKKLKGKQPFFEIIADKFFVAKEIVEIMDLEMMKTKLGFEWSGETEDDDNDNGDNNNNNKENPNPNQNQKIPENSKDT